MGIGDNTKLASDPTGKKCEDANGDLTIEPGEYRLELNGGQLSDTGILLAEAKVCPGEKISIPIPRSEINRAYSDHKFNFKATSNIGVNHLRLFLKNNLGVKAIPSFTVYGNDSPPVTNVDVGFGNYASAQGVTVHVENEEVGVEQIQYTTDGILPQSMTSGNYTELTLTAAQSNVSTRLWQLSKLILFLHRYLLFKTRIVVLIQYYEFFRVVVYFTRKIG